jgi:hypothetical protein
MDRQANVMESNTSRSRVEDGILAVLGAAAGTFVLWLTWYFYRDALSVPVIDWLGLVQPTLMIVGGVMGLGAAVLLAFSILPLLLALRLVVLIVRVIVFIVGWGFNNASGIIDGTAFVDVRLSAWNIANIVLLVALVVYWGVRKRTQRPGTRNDTR